jgi:hypothetical protein
MATTRERTDSTDTDSGMVGVINPYALAEVVAGHTIDWARVAEPRHLLEDLLVTPYEQLFDPVHESPLYLGLQVGDGGLERVRPAVPDVTLPTDPHDDDQLTFGDLGRLRRIGDLGAYFDTKDVADIAIDSASYADHGVLRLLIAQVGQSRLERLARVLTPTIITSILDVPDFEPPDDVVFEPPVSYWGDNGTFFAEAAEFFDPVQGAVANCYLIAAMSAVAWAQPYRIRHLTRATGAGQQQFVNKVQLFDSGTHTSSDVEVSDAIPIRYSNNRPMYARSSEAGETWPSILEKAYAKWESGHTGDTPSIPSTAYGSPARACAELTGLSKWSVATAGSSADDLWSLVRQNSRSHRTFNPMVASTYGSGQDSPDKVVYADANLVANHAYTVLGWDYRDGKKYVILRNPWGSTEATQGSLAGTAWFYDISWWRSISLAESDGVFGLETSVFKSYFSHLGGAK